MTQEDKELLFKDLCARLPYGVKVHNEPYTFDLDNFEVSSTTTISENILEIIKEGWKPCLRPMSSMTEEEKEEWEKTFDTVYDYAPGENKEEDNIIGCHDELGIGSYDWLNAHHFDYRGLIDKGLAIEAPEGMYKIKEK